MAPRNQFNGSLPSFAGSLGLKELDLGANDFSGEIPPIWGSIKWDNLFVNFFNLPSPLWYLIHAIFPIDRRVYENSLTGILPEWICNGV